MHCLPLPYTKVLISLVRNDLGSYLCLLSSLKHALLRGHERKFQYLRDGSSSALRALTDINQVSETAHSAI